jgi:phasin family protein
MSTRNEIADSSRTNVDAALRMAGIIAQANERLFHLQSNAATAAFAQNSKLFGAVLNVTDAGALLADWPRLFQANVAKVLEVTRSAFEIVSKTQAEVARLMGETYAASNMGVPVNLLNLDQFTKAINEGRDAAMAGMQSILAKAGEHVGGEAAKRQKAA